MKNKYNRIELYIEGYSIDLTDQDSLKNGVTYASPSSVKNLSKKYSSVSKTIEIPGTDNNNKLFNFLWNPKNTTDNFFLPDTYSAKIANNISGLSITGINVNPVSGSSFIPDTTLGLGFTYPINNGGSSISFHNAIYNNPFYFTVTGNTDSSGYVICKLNGTIISTNKITAAVSNYYFPVGLYAFDDVLEIDFQTTFQKYSGNIGYAFKPNKKAKAVLYENGQEILSGYAKLLEAKVKDKDTSYSISITSEIGGFTSALGNTRLEDLYTTQTPNLTIDSTGQTPLTVNLPSPYDHVLNLQNCVNSWYDGFSGSVYYPLCDFGGNKDSAEKDRSDLTINGTSFNTSVLRPCLPVKDYIDLIFQSVGYTYESNFLNSSYFKSLLQIYSDGNFTITNNYPVTATTGLSGSALTIAVPFQGGGGPVSGSDIYPFTEIVSDTYNVYNASLFKYTATNAGIYNFSTNLLVNWQLIPSNISITLLPPPMFVNVQYDIYASGSSSPYVSKFDLWDIAANGITFNGQSFFMGVTNTDSYNISFQNTALTLNAGDFVKVGIYPATSFPLSGLYHLQTFPSSTIAGTANFSIVGEPTLQVSLSPLMDGQFISYSDFVPKSVKCIDYIDSLFKMFNLYPEQDKIQLRKLNIFTRDEYFSDQTLLDWTGKIDMNSPIVVKPIPSLDAKQLLFSFKKDDKSFWNKQYESLYGGYDYGSRRETLDYDFSAGQVKDVLKGILFSATPSVQYTNNLIFIDTAIEILNANNLGGSTSTIISCAGYNASGTGTKILSAKTGVGIVYQGITYYVANVYSPYSFSIRDSAGNNPVLTRPGGAVNGTYFATNDFIYFITNSNVIVPQIYESADNNQTHKPVKTPLKILSYKPISLHSTPFVNPYYVQYTPYLYSGSYNYYGGGPSGSAIKMFQAPWTGHIDDIASPQHDLLFSEPEALFFNLSGSYPEKNLYRYYQNTVNMMQDLDGRFVEANLKLNSLDISNLDLSNKVHINGTNYLINQITDYKAGANELTKCELLRQPLFQQLADSPIVQAGPDQFNYTPFFSSSVDGLVSVDEANGAILKSTLWTQVSGPTATINNPTNLFTTLITPLTGSYIFQLSATDSFGSVGTDTVNITLATRIPAFPDILSIGNNGPITIPTTTNVNLACSFIGQNGGVVTSSTWTKIGGPGSPTITSPTSFDSSSNNTSVTGFTNTGSYNYQIAVTDQFGETSFATSSFSVYAVPLVSIQNNTSGVIAGESGITGFSSVSIAAMTTATGSHSSFTGTIAISFTSAAAGSTNLTLLKNGGLVQNIPITSGTATQTFGSSTFGSTDQLQILWS